MKHIALALPVASLCLAAPALAQTVLYDASGGQKVSQFGGWSVSPTTFESFSSRVVSPSLSNNLCVWRDLCAL